MISAADVGDLITFGAYPQTAGGDDRTPITWRVLQASGEELFLLSESILDCKRYHRAFEAITWRDCDFRAWLNEDFFHSAFSAAEQASIRTTLCTDNGEGSPESEDKLFLLSVAEVKSPDRCPQHGGRGADARRRGDAICHGPESRRLQALCL